MKRTLPFLLLLLLITSFVSAQMITGADARKIVKGSDAVMPGKYGSVPDYVHFTNGNYIAYKDVKGWIAKSFQLQSAIEFKLLSTENDKLGFIHYRLQQTVNNIAVEGTMYIMHTKDGLVQSMNGQIITNAVFPKSEPVLNEAAALEDALTFIGATKYKWQAEGNSKLYPKAQLVYVGDNGKLSAKQFLLAYKFDIYAQQPLSRHYVYVDANTGKIIKSTNRIEHSDVNATAATQFSGSRTIVTDSYGGAYRLQEAGRGGGIVTLNAQAGTNTGAAVDFTNFTTTWNNVNLNLDQYATDAHLASEATYDFYMQNFNRNSIDDGGVQLLSYVHYDFEMENAFWDGEAMNYGDGSSADDLKPFTSLEIGGHEITHGLTQYTANLDYQDESGALNESFSDCMGVSIRQFLKQSSTIDYLLGDELGTNSTFRSMIDPNLFQHPSTYLGNYWYVGTDDNGGVHTNSGVQNHWYYLVSHGGSGTNDNGVVYNITGIGIDKAAAITFRTLTVYLTSESQYADARTYAIQAAIDLYGECSNEESVVANAWYAVGVGNAYTPAVVADFTPDITALCSAPGTVNFTDNSSNATNYNWNFGDGSTSTSTNPMHTYTAYGTYTVKLSVSSICGTDSVIKTQLIHVNNDAPVVGAQTICGGNHAYLSATGNGVINWYGSATDTAPIDSNSNSFITPVLNSSATYYAEAVTWPAVHRCGPATDNFGIGDYYSDYLAYSEIFTCTAPQTLVSVDMYAQDAGDCVIDLQDTSGNLLMQTEVTLAAGLNTVALNFPLPVGANMYLQVSNFTGLYYNQSGAAYPYYSSDSTVIITNSDAGVDGYFLFFYNWKLQGLPCVSERTPVAVTVTAGIACSFTFLSNANTVSFAPTNTSLLSYTWLFGDGATSTSQSPSHTYAAIGTYTAQLIVSNGTCVDTVEHTVTVTTVGIGDISSLDAISIFPNPANNELNVHITTSTAIGNCKVMVTNILGEHLIDKDMQLTAGSNAVVLNISAIANGVYFVTLQKDGNTATERFVKLN